MSIMQSPQRSWCATATRENRTPRSRTGILLRPRQACSQLHLCAACGVSPTGGRIRYNEVAATIFARRITLWLP